MWNIETEVKIGFVKIRYTNDFLNLLKNAVLEQIFDPEVAPGIILDKAGLFEKLNTDITFHNSYYDFPVGKMVLDEKTGIITPLIMHIDSENYTYSFYQLFINDGQLMGSFRTRMEKNKLLKPFSLSKVTPILLSSLGRASITKGLMSKVERNIRKHMIVTTPISEEHFSQFRLSTKLYSSGKNQKHEAERKMEFGSDLFTKLLRGETHSSTDDLLEFI